MGKILDKVNAKKFADEDHPEEKDITAED